MDAYYSSMVAEMTVNVAALKEIRKNNISSAVEILEMRVNANRIFLNDEAELDVSKERKIAIGKIISSVDEYNQPATRMK